MGLCWPEFRERRAHIMPWRWRGFIRQYSWAALGGDAAGGLVAALIALPYGLALASLMGLPVLLGVVTSVIASPICALFGRNPVLIGGVSSVTVPFIAAAVAHDLVEKAERLDPDQPGAALGAVARQRTAGIA